MPPSSPTTRQEREQFLAEMTDQERRTFDALAEAMKAKEGDRDLSWYRTLGKGVHDLRGEEGGAAGGYGGMKRLAAALGCSASLLNKTRDFARTYTAREARRLADDGIKWGWVFPTFTLEDK